MSSEESTQQLMLLELRKIASGRGGAGGLGGPRVVIQTYTNLNKEIDKNTKAEIAKFAGLKEQTKLDKARAKASNSLLGGMIQQNLVMAPINSLLGGFFEAFEPITDAFGALGETAAAGMAGAISGIANSILTLMPVFDTLGKVLGGIISFLTAQVPSLGGGTWSAAGGWELGGAAAGWLFGGPLGAAIGWGAGALIDIWF